MLSRSRSPLQSRDRESPSSETGTQPPGLTFDPLGSAATGNDAALLRLAALLTEDDLAVLDQLGADGAQTLAQVSAVSADREALLTLAGLRPSEDELAAVEQVDEAGLSDDEISDLQALAEGGAEVGDLDGLESVAQSGAPLDRLSEASESGPGRRVALPHKGDMERAFGEDLSDVPVRVGDAAALAPLGADAAASDGGLSFSSTSPTREEVAHEVAHIVQDRRSGATSGVSTPGGRGELEAERAAKDVAAGRPAEVSAQRPGQVARKAWYEHVGDFFAGAYEGARDTVSGVATMAQGLNNLINPVIWIVSPEKTVQSWNTLTTTVKTIATDPGVVWDAFKEPFVEDWNNGRPGAAIGRGVFEVVSLLVGTKGLDKLAKGSKLLGAADDVAKVANKVDDVAKVANKVDDAAKVTNKADDASRVADAWSRQPKSVQDQMVLDAAKQGQGTKIIDNLGDPNFKGMEKWEYKVKSADGRDTVVHYVRDPRTGELMDFKFKKHSTDFLYPPGT